MNKKSVVLLFLLLGYSLTSLAVKATRTRGGNFKNTRNIGAQYDEDDWLFGDTESSDEDDYVSQKKSKRIKHSRKNLSPKNEIGIQTDTATSDVGRALLEQALTDHLKNLSSNPEMQQETQKMLRRIVASALGQVRDVLVNSIKASSNAAAPILPSEPSELSASNTVVNSSDLEKKSIEEPSNNVEVIPENSSVKVMSDKGYDGVVPEDSSVKVMSDKGYNTLKRNTRFKRGGSSLNKESMVRHSGSSVREQDLEDPVGDVSRSSIILPAAFEDDVRQDESIEESGILDKMNKAVNFVKEKLVDPTWFTQIKNILSRTSKSKNKGVTAFKAIRSNLERGDLTIDNIKAKINDINMTEDVKKDFEKVLSNYAFSKTDLKDLSAIAKRTRKNT